MNGTKKLWVVVLVLALIAVLAAGALWCVSHYVVMNFRFYPKNAQALDLRDEDISLEDYQKLCSRLPGCEIQWNVPFQGRRYPDNTRELTITSLSDADVKTLDYLTELETVNAEQCTDYTQLLALQKRRPEVEVNFSVTLGGVSFDPDTTKITVDRISAEEISLLECLKSLKTVVVSGGGDTANFAQLQEYCHAHDLEFCVKLGGKTVADTERNLSVTNISDDELKLLQFLPDMKQLHMIKPKASAENLVQLRQANPNAEITWEQEICGKVFTTEDTEIDLSEAEIKSLDQVEQGMAYFPDAEQVFLGDCGLDNEEIAAYRERVREDYKVVWIVYCSEKLPTRTDATSFMPSRDGVGYFKDEWSYNLRYCEDMIAIDVGHMGVRDISFVAYMPNLKYLILAHTEVSDITPISNCKNLIFLELDWSPISDYTPLLGCTALEDLNIGKYGADVTPICQMTWLKNVWCIFRPASAGKIAQALPNTHVVGSGNATVSSGWRNLPNYYAMRDALNMYYMKW
ncbi:MAG: hypothetical protein ACI4PH_05475 [Faecousia sp.]